MVGAGSDDPQGKVAKVSIAWGRVFVACACWLVCAVLTIGYLAWNMAPWQDVSPIVSVQPQEAHLVLGSGATFPAGSDADSDALVRIDAMTESGESLAVFPLQQQADQLAVLQIEIENAPQDAVVMLAWRSAQGGDAAQFTRLHTADGSTQTYLLSPLEGWAGVIQEVTVYIHPQPNSRWPLPLDEPITIKRLAFKSDSVSARVAALFTAWRAPDPWRMLSISSLGIYEDLAEPIRLTPVVAMLSALGIFIFGLFLAGRRFIVWLRIAVFWVVLASVVGTIKWQYNLARQVALTQSTYAGKSWDERRLQEFDRDIQLAVAEVKRLLKAESAPKIYIHGPARFFRLRAAYHLRPLNVYSALPGRTMTGGQHLRRGEYIFVYDQDDFVAQAASGPIRLGSASVRTTVIMRQPEAALLRIEQVQP